MTDFSEMPVYITMSHWQTMRIEVQESNITFILGDKVITSVKDSQYNNGDCGVAYHEYFRDNKLIKGTRVRNFRASLLE